MSNRISLSVTVRLTAVILVFYSLAMFSFGLFVPIWVYNAGWLDLMVIPFSLFYIFIGFIIIFISFGLFEGAYLLFHRKAHGAVVGIAATICSFFPAALVLYLIILVREEERLVGERLNGNNTKPYLTVFLFLLFNIIFIYELSRAGRILAFGEKRS